MKRSNMMTVRELRTLLNQYPEDAVIMITAENAYNQALAVHSYNLSTTLDHKNIVLLTQDTTESLRFANY